LVFLNNIDVRKRSRNRVNLPVDNFRPASSATESEVQDDDEDDDDEEKDNDRDIVSGGGDDEEADLLDTLEMLKVVPSSSSATSCNGGADANLFHARKSFLRFFSVEPVASPVPVCVCGRLWREAFSGMTSTYWASEE